MSGVRRGSFEHQGRSYVVLVEGSELSLRVDQPGGAESLCTGRIKGGIVTWHAELADPLSELAVATARRLAEAPEEAPAPSPSKKTKPAAPPAPEPAEAAARRRCSLCQKTDHTSRNCPKRNQKPKAKAARPAAAPPPPSPAPKRAAGPPPGRPQRGGVTAMREQITALHGRIRELEAAAAPAPPEPLPELGGLSVPVLAFAVRQALRLLRGVSGPPSVAVAVDILTDAMNFTERSTP